MFTADLLVIAKNMAGKYLITYKLTKQSIIYMNNGIVLKKGRKYNNMQKYVAQHFYSGWR